LKVEPAALGVIAKYNLVIPGDYICKPVRIC
jgi:hypothetical protein